MSRITSVKDFYEKTGVKPCRGFGGIHNDVRTACGLVVCAVARSGLSFEDVIGSHTYIRLSTLADVSYCYALSFTWGFDGNCHTDKSDPKLDLQGFEDGQACYRELLDAKMF